MAAESGIEDQVTIFYLVRHGEPTVFGRINGRLNGIRLSPKGRAEIAAVAERLAGEGIEAIYASPLDRTRETAEIIAARFDLPVVIREDVIEVDFGDWTGLTFDQVRTDERWRPWQTCRSVATIPGGISRIAQQPGFDVSQGSFVPPQPDSLEAILVAHEQSCRDAQKFLEGLSDQRANQGWRLLRNGAEVWTKPRISVIRTIMLNHWYHHRGQLSVYLRLLNVPVPVIYGRSADEYPFG